MTCEGRVKRLARRHLPEDDGLVETAGGQGSAIRAEDQAVNAKAGVDVPNLHFQPAGYHIPQGNTCPVGAGQDVAIGAKRPGRLAAVGQGLFGWARSGAIRGHAPHQDRPILAAGNQDAAVSIEEEVGNVAGMCCER